MVVQICYHCKHETHFICNNQTSLVLLNIVFTPPPPQAKFITRNKMK